MSTSVRGTHKYKINSIKFIQLYLLTPLYIVHLYEKTRSYTTDCVLDILI